MQYDMSEPTIPTTMYSPPSFPWRGVDNEGYFERTLATVKFGDIGNTQAFLTSAFCGHPDVEALAKEVSEFVWYGHVYDHKIHMDMPGKFFIVTPYPKARKPTSGVDWTYGKGLGDRGLGTPCNLVFEIDAVSLTEQCRRLDAMVAIGVPMPNAACSSGGKSIHVIYAVSNMTWEQRDRLQSMLLAVTGADPSVGNRGRKMRLGGYKDELRTQTILHLDSTPTTVEAMEAGLNALCAAWGMTQDPVDVLSERLSMRATKGKANHGTTMRSSKGSLIGTWDPTSMMVTLASGGEVLASTLPVGKHKCECPFDTHTKSPMSAAVIVGKNGASIHCFPCGTTWHPDVPVATPHDAPQGTEWDDMAFAPDAEAIKSSRATLRAFYADHGVPMKRRLCIGRNQVLSNGSRDMHRPTRCGHISCPFCGPQDVATTVAFIDMGFAEDKTFIYSIDDKDLPKLKWAINATPHINTSAPICCTSVYMRSSTKWVSFFDSSTGKTKLVSNVDTSTRTSKRARDWNPTPIEVNEDLVMSLVMNAMTFTSGNMGIEVKLHMSSSDTLPTKKPRKSEFHVLANDVGRANYKRAADLVGIKLTEQVSIVPDDGEFIEIDPRWGTLSTGTITKAQRMAMLAAMQEVPTTHVNVESADALVDAIFNDTPMPTPQVVVPNFTMPVLPLEHYEDPQVFVEEPTPVAYVSQVERYLAILDGV